MSGYSFTTSFCIEHNTKCAGTLFGMPENQRYRRIRSNTLIDRGLYQLVNSARLRKSWQSDASLILFFTRPGYSGRDFQGPFWQITKHYDDPTAWYPLGTVPSNSALHSALLVAPNFKGTSESRISLKSTRFPQKADPQPDGSDGGFALLPFMVAWNRSIEDILEEGVSTGGEPIFSWDMWPRNISHLSENHWYIRLHQSLLIDVDKIKDLKIEWYKTYDASFTYHVRFYFDENGTLKVHGSRWGVWVEDGVVKNVILKKIASKVAPGLAKVVSGFETLLDGVRAQFDIHDFYLLPGSQGTDIINQSYPGSPPLYPANTLDDVTIVFEGD